MEITRDSFTVKIEDSNGGYITSQSVQAILLFEILQILKSGITPHAPNKCAAPDCEEPAIYTIGLCGSHVHPT